MGEKPFKYTSNDRYSPLQTSGALPGDNVSLIPLMRHAHTGHTLTPLLASLLQMEATYPTPSCSGLDFVFLFCFCF